MDFFDKQELARKRTRWLVIYFFLAVVGIILALHTAFCMALGQRWDDLPLLGITAAGVLLAVLIGSLVKIAELSQGGKVVAKMLGGTLVEQGSADSEERRLLNVVEEMALASGVPVPEVYVLEEDAINAFAAGFGTSDAVVGVTRGCLRQLTRDELQGVIGHEFSHILNGDMRLNIRLMGLLNGILFLAIMGGILFRIAASSQPRSRSSDNKNGGSITAALFVAGIALYIVGWIGVFFGKLIKAAVSRQREYLADASAVQFTRNPDGLAGALRKIGQLTSKLENPRAEEASHLFFGNGLAVPWLNLFATHPPIEDRIAQIAPHFEASRTEPTPPPLPVTEPGEPHVAAAVSMLAGLPDFSRTAAHDVHGACALVYALLADDSNDSLDTIEVDNAMQAAIRETLVRRSELGSAQKFALVDMAIPSLRRLSPHEYSTFRANVKKLIEVDGQVYLFEYTLQKILLRHLDATFSKPTPTRIHYRKITPLLPDVCRIFSALANTDESNEAGWDLAFQAGVEKLGKDSMAYPFAREAQVHLNEFDSSLDRLAEASPAIKRSLLHACAALVLHDGTVNDLQFELLRAIAETLDCPIPPSVPCP